jgi:hypothetical protein
MTSGAKSAGRFGKQDFLYLPEEDVHRCPAGEHLKYYYTNDVLEAVQRRLDEDPQGMRRRRETVEHPFGTIKALHGPFVIRKYVAPMRGNGSRASRVI